MCSYEYVVVVSACLGAEVLEHHLAAGLVREHLHYHLVARALLLALRRQRRLDHARRQRERVRDRRRLPVVRDLQRTTRDAAHVQLLCDAKHVRPTRNDQTPHEQQELHKHVPFARATNTVTKLHL